MGIYDNEAMTSYLNELGQKLVSKLDKSLFKYQFKLAPDMSSNAFALPGGYICYYGIKLIDGGVLNPVPIAPTFNNETDLIIAVNLGGPMMKEEKKPRKQGLR